MQTPKINNLLNNIIKDYLAKNSIDKLNEDFKNSLPNSYNTLKQKLNLSKDKDLDLVSITLFSKLLMSNINSNNKEINNNLLHDKIDKEIVNNDINDNDINDNDINDNDINDNTITINNFVYQRISIKMNQNNEQSDDIKIFSLLDISDKLSFIYNDLLVLYMFIPLENKDNNVINENMFIIIELSLLIIDIIKISVKFEQQDNLEIIEDISNNLSEINITLENLKTYIDLTYQDEESFNQFLQIFTKINKDFNDIFRYF